MSHCKRYGYINTMRNSFYYNCRWAISFHMVCTHGIMCKIHFPFHFYGQIANCRLWHILHHREQQLSSTDIRATHKLHFRTHSWSAALLPLGKLRLCSCCQSALQSTCQCSRDSWSCCKCSRRAWHSTLAQGTASFECQGVLRRLGSPLPGHLRMSMSGSCYQTNRGSLYISCAGKCLWAGLAQRGHRLTGSLHTAAHAFLMSLQSELMTPWRMQPHRVTRSEYRCVPVW